MVFSSAHQQRTIHPTSLLSPSPILHNSVSIILVLVRHDVTACSLDFYSRKDPKQSEVSEGDSIVMGIIVVQGVGTWSVRLFSHHVSRRVS
mmetsp:Transcript_19999/g.20328  ORF Transcript_19999/g.20328 Transcript_19999/m.20328 type:complete len:91 (-) Transcript_19999:190-462(-)